MLHGILVVGSRVETLVDSLVLASSWLALSVSRGRRRHCLYADGLVDGFVSKLVDICADILVDGFILKLAGACTGDLADVFTARLHLDRTSVLKKPICI